MLHFKKGIGWQACYDDEENLGAAKASVYTDGGMIIYLFDDHGRNMKKEVKTFLDISEAEGSQSSFGAP